MLVKCESKSPRVKGLSFHPRLSWVLVSLHNGTIQLWDYRLGCLIEKFEEHAGPVRGVHFHPTQTLFCSGGDDHLIKVWDYKERASLFSLVGHLDYIRTTEFHNRYPWICSCSDDQTVRIWNWQSRSCLAVLAGHHHYVMCATFHPNGEDILASASLDQTIRVWDLSGLREKTVSSGKRGNALQMNSEVFGAADAVCRFILEGHDRGVNWVTFHPTSKMIASGADDRLIKLWRYDETKWWEVDTLRGHFNNVSCVAFHPLADMLISNSEDRTIRVWDLSKRSLLHSYRRDTDRFWVLSCQPNSNLIAVGHDSGMVVFKLLRERPPGVTWFDEVQHKLQSLFVRDNQVFFQPDAQANASQTSLSCSVAPPDEVCENRNAVALHHGILRKPLDALNGHPHLLLRNALNPTEWNIAILYRAATNGPTDAKWAYDVHTLSLNQMTAQPRTESGTCNSFAFCARNRYVTLDSRNCLWLHTLAGATGAEVRKPISIPKEFGADALFYAGNNKVLIRGEDSVMLLDVITKKQLGLLNLTIAGSQAAKGRIRQAIWSANGQLVALVSKNYICLADASLHHLRSLHECIRVKSGCWDEHKGFVYNTASHLKYLLPNGDTGIFQSIPESGGGVYIQSIIRNKLFFLTRRGELKCVAIDSSEELLKLALGKEKLDTVAMLLKNKRLPGHAWVGYLKRKGFPEIAYHCVSDPATRAVLATEFADLEAAIEAVTQLNSPAGWSKLGEVALRLGNPEVAEISFQKAGLYHRLIQLYVVTGNFLNLKKLGELMQSLGDIPTAFHISMLTGNVEQRLALLKSQKKFALAWIFAARHGLASEQKEIEGHLEASVIERLKSETAQHATVAPPRLLFPPLPVALSKGSQQWPLRKVPETPGALAVSGAFKELLAQAPVGVQASDLSRDLAVDKGNMSANKSSSTGIDGPAEIPIDMRAWGDGEEDEDWFDETDGAAKTTDTLPGMETLGQTSLNKAGDPELGEFATRGVGVVNRALSGVSKLGVYDLLVKGEFQQALGLIKSKMNIGNTRRLLPLFLAVHQSSLTFVPTMPLLSPLPIPVISQGSIASECPKIRRAFTWKMGSDNIRSGIVHFSSHKLEEAAECFRKALALVPVVDVENEETMNREIATARNYLLAIRLEQARSECSSSQSERDLHLRLLSTACDLQKSHKFLLLREAVKAAFKAEDYAAAAACARRIILGEFVGVAPAEIERMKRVLVQCESKGSANQSALVDVRQSPEEWRICCNSLRVEEKAMVACGVCGGLAGSECAQELCKLCELGLFV